MKEILETKQLEFDKSTFLIDLIQHENGSQYVEILQQIHADNSDGQKIKINPSILMDIVNILLEFQEKIPKKQLDGVLHFTEIDKNKLQDRYLRGISTTDLALQFDTSESIIEMILRNKGITVMKDIEHVKKNRWRKRK